MKTVKFVFTWVLLVTSFAVMAQRDKDWNSKTYPLKEFKDLYLEGGYHVYLVQGNEYSLTVKASDDNVFDYLDVKNNEQLLSLKISRNNLNLDRINLYITFKDLEGIHIQGGVNVYTDGYLDLHQISMHISGGAKMEMKLKADNIDITGEGGLYYQLMGVAGNLNIRLSGAGHVDASEMKAKNVDIRVEGVATGSVYATEQLNASIQGVGKITYKGNPKVSRHIDGLGSISSE